MTRYSVVGLPIDRVRSALRRNGWRITHLKDQPTIPKLQWAGVERRTSYSSVSLCATSTSTVPHNKPYPRVGLQPLGAQGTLYYYRGPLCHRPHRCCNRICQGNRNAIVLHIEIQYCTITCNHNFGSWGPRNAWGPRPVCLVCSWWSVTVLPHDATIPM